MQYLAVDKITVTALLVTPGFLWVGTSFGLILVYPLPKLQGVPRVVGRACVAFHAHCGPVRSLLAVPEGTFQPQTAVDDNLTSSVSGIHIVTCNGLANLPFAEPLANTFHTVSTEAKKMAACTFYRDILHTKRTPYPVKLSHYKKKDFKNFVKILKNEAVIFRRNILNCF